MNMKLTIENRKRIAAEVACKFLEDGIVLGVGTGSTVKYFIEFLGKMIRNGALRNIYAVPSSYDTHFRLVQEGVKVVSLIEFDELDLTIDGADSVLMNNNVLIKGGGGALFREKVINYAARKRIIIVDDTKINRRFPIPVEVHHFAIGYVLKSLRELGLKASLRSSKCKVGPCISDNGNILLDAEAPLELITAELEVKLNSIPGILENGIFSKEAEIVVGKADGSYEILKLG